MFVITYKTQTKGFKIHGLRSGVFGVVEKADNVISVMDTIVMNAIEHPYANPFHDGFEVQHTFANIASPGSEPVATFGVVYVNDKGEEVKDIYIADWVEKLD